MNIQIQRSARKSIAIKIDVNGKIKILCPYKCSLKQIENLVEEKKQWIENALAKIHKKFVDNQSLYDYKQILFLGNKYDVVVEKNTISVGDYTIKIRKNSVEKTLKEWLIKQANALILGQLDKLSELTSINYFSSKIISARKKWGSCDRRKNIKLNFRLVMLPLECINYVCIHELCHINQMNHSKQFYSEVAKFMPNYKYVVKEMKQFSYALELF